MRWPGWKYLPAVKPLAIAGSVFVATVLIVYVFRGTDIPVNMADLLKTMFLVFLGVYGGKSVIEHGIDKYADSKKPWEDDDSDGKK